MSYRRITGSKELSDALASPETWELDFKQAVKIKEWWELAKDVSAFANHVGGVLLVGVKEGNPGLPGLPESEARRVARAYEEVAKDHCRPQPHVTTDVLPHPAKASEFVAVANVEPFPDQIVGCHAPKRDDQGKLVRPDAWRFYVRIGKHNQPITPEQLPMYMNPRTRRTAILLDSIPHGKRELTIFWRRPGNQFDEKPVLQSFNLEKIDLAGNVLVLETFRQGQTSYQIRVPLDDVDSVWEFREGSWGVRVTGFFEGGTDYVTNPTNAVIVRR